MAGFNYIGQVKDGPTASALNALASQIQAIQSQLTTLSQEALRSGSPFDAGGQRIVNVESPQGPKEVVNVQYLRQQLTALLGAFGGGSGSVVGQGAIGPVGPPGMNWPPDSPGEPWAMGISSTFTGGSVTPVNYIWVPLTDGDPIEPSLIFDSDGNCVMAQEFF